MTRTYALVRRRWWATVVALVAMLVVAWLPSPVAASESPVRESHSTPWAAPTYEYDVASVPRGHGADRYDVDANLVAVAAHSDDRRTIGQRPSVARSEPSRASSAELGAPRAVLPTPQVTNSKLQNVVNDLYKGTTNPARVGTGTTADAVRNELVTGLPTGGTFHLQKAEQYSNALRSVLKQDLSYHDRLVAQSLLDDLQRAMRGQP